MEAITAQLGLIFEAVGTAFDAFGVAAIVLGVLLATLRLARQRRESADGQSAYRRYKVEIGLSLLLGLELLLAADIIKTVALQPNFTNLGILAGLVIIRTFLSWTLQLEIEGRWPWQQKVVAGAEIEHGI